LKQLFTFLNIPFLKLRLSETEKTLQKIKEELKTAQQEVDILLEEDYDSFVERNTELRKNAPASPPQPISV